MDIITQSHGPSSTRPAYPPVSPVQRLVRYLKGVAGPTSLGLAWGLSALPAASQAEPLYVWRDAHGVLNYSDTAPAAVPRDVRRVENRVREKIGTVLQRGQARDTTKPSDSAPTSYDPTTSVGALGIGTTTTGGVTAISGDATAMRARSTAAVSTAAPLPTGQPLWTAGMEGGNLNEWYANDCGDKYDTLDGSTVPTRDYAHSGRWSAKMTISATSSGGSTSATRLYRWCEQKLNRELYYSTWFYLPQRYQVNFGGWANWMQFKGVDASYNSPFFILDLANFSTGMMRLKLTWWPGLKVEGPLPGQSGGRSWLSSLEIPVGRWFQVEVRHVCAPDFAGAIQVWQDGVEIFKLEGVKTRYPTGRCEWSLNNYGEKLSPSPVVLYVDDVVISRTRVGP